MGLSAHYRSPIQTLSLPKSTYHLRFPRKVYLLPFPHPLSNFDETISNLSSSGMQTGPFHKFLLSHAKLPPFTIVKPFVWQNLFFTIFCILTIATVTKFAWPEVQKIITNKNAWAAASLVTILLFTSGHMYN